ncbi:MAG: hypothetical protein AAFY88_07025, partial [Acidobacteriota bacterium]
DDFRNRTKWPEYEAAVSEMLRKTSSRRAPWTVIPANDKKYARIACLETIEKRLARGVDLAPPPMDQELRHEAEVQLDVEPEELRRLAADGAA